MPKIRIYQTKEKESPFEDWLDNLIDINAKARILQRIDRIELGISATVSRLETGFMN